MPVEFNWCGRLRPVACDEIEGSETWTDRISLHPMSYYDPTIDLDHIPPRKQ
jgi:hypothetical protein